MYDSLPTLKEVRGLGGRRGAGRRLASLLARPHAAAGVPLTGPACLPMPPRHGLIDRWTTASAASWRTRRGQGRVAKVGGRLVGGWPVGSTQLPGAAAGRGMSPAILCAAVLLTCIVSRADNGEGEGEAGDGSKPKRGKGSKAGKAKGAGQPEACWGCTRRGSCCSASPEGGLIQCAVWRMSNACPSHPSYSLLSMQRI